MDKEITKEQFEKFNDELKDLGYRCTMGQPEGLHTYVTIYKDLAFVADISCLSITFFDWEAAMTFSEKCHILELATKYFVE